MAEERRRKLSIMAEEQEPCVDDDDERIEKFFTIISRLRDARNYLTSNLQELDVCGTAKKARKVTATEWTPAFQLEDFSEAELRAAQAASLTQPGSMIKEREKEEKEGIDLNLSL